MSKFDYELFVDTYSDERCLAVSKQRYTEQQAVEIAKRALDVENVTLSNDFSDFCYVYRGFGTNYDGENYNGWWLVDYKPKRGCPVWVFSAVEEG